MNNSPSKEEISFMCREKATETFQNRNASSCHQTIHFGKSQLYGWENHALSRPMLLKKCIPKEPYSLANKVLETWQNLSHIQDWNGDVDCLLSLRKDPREACA